MTSRAKDDQGEIIMKLNFLFITFILLAGCAYEQQVAPLSTDENAGVMDGCAVAAAL